MLDLQNLPRRHHSKRLGCLVLLLTYVGLPIVLFESVKVAFNILERPAIEALYGTQAYTEGLRVIGRQGQLSNGRHLTVGWNYTLAIGAFVLSMPASLGYCAILAAFGLFPPDRFWRKE